MIRTKFMFKSYYELSVNEKFILAYLCLEFAKGRTVIPNSELVSIGLSSRTIDRAVAVMADLELLTYKPWKNTKVYEIDEEVINDVLQRSTQ